MKSIIQKKVMKRKTQGVTLLTLLMIASCGTFNNGAFLNGHQGKNKVIERDFEAKDQFEEENKIVETEEYNEPTRTQESQPESSEPELNPTQTIQPVESAMGPEESIYENLNEVSDNTFSETTVEEYEQTEIETVVQSESNDVELGVIVIVALILIILLIVSILIFMFSIIVEFLSWS